MRAVGCHEEASRSHENSCLEQNDSLLQVTVTAAEKVAERSAENAMKQIAVHAAESMYKQQFARILEQRLAAGVI